VSGIGPDQDQTILAIARESEQGKSTPRDIKNSANNGKSPDTAVAESEARQQLLAFVRDFGREFNDAASLRSSTSRMANLYHDAHVPMDVFIAHLYAARATTQERTGAIRVTVGTPDVESRKNKMGYFFSVLESRLGLRESPDGAEPASNGMASVAVAGTTPPPRARSAM